MRGLQSRRQSKTKSGGCAADDGGNPGWEERVESVQGSKTPSLLQTRKGLGEAVSCTGVPLGGVEAGGALSWTRLGGVWVSQASSRLRVEPASLSWPHGTPVRAAEVRPGLERTTVMTQVSGSLVPVAYTPVCSHVCPPGGAT